MGEKYNGWTNYETWLAALWIQNSGDDEYIQERARHCCENNDTKGDATYDLSKEIDDFFDEENPLNDQASLYSDLVRAGLSEINWHEIAEHYIDDAWEEKPDEEEDEVEEDES